MYGKELTAVKKTIIITSYIEHPFPVDGLITPDDLVICTDGGYDIAKKNNIIPDVLLGDFDSISDDYDSIARNLSHKIDIIKFNPEKDFTDLDLAIKEAIARNSSHVEIWGGIGGRLDHTVANLQILTNYGKDFESLQIMDGRNRCFVLYGSDGPDRVIPKQEDSYLSLFSMSECCRGLTVSGVKYSLHNHTMFRTFPLGVSNEITSDEAVISMKEGTLLVVISRKESAML